MILRIDVLSNCAALPLERAKAPMYEYSCSRFDMLESATVLAPLSNPVDETRAGKRPEKPDSGNICSGRSPARESRECAMFATLDVAPTAQKQQSVATMESAGEDRGVKTSRHDSRTPELGSQKWYFQNLRLVQNLQPARNLLRGATFCAFVLSANACASDRDQMTRRLQDLEAKLTELSAENTQLAERLSALELEARPTAQPSIDAPTSFGVAPKRPLKVVRLVPPNGDEAGRTAMSDTAASDHSAAAAGHGTHVGKADVGKDAPRAGASPSDGTASEAASSSIPPPGNGASPAAPPPLSEPRRKGDPTGSQGNHQP